MKKKALLAGAAIAVGSALLLTSCGASNVYQDYREAHLFTKSEQLVELTGYNALPSSAKYMYFTKTNTGLTTHKLYEIEENKVIKTLTDTEKVKYSFTAGGNYYAVSIVDTTNAVPSYSTELYQTNGKKVATEKSDVQTEVAVSETDFNNDGYAERVTIGTKSYKIEENGNIKYNFDFKDKTVSSQFQGEPTAFAGGYLFYKSGNVIYTFDDTFTLVNRYVVPSGDNVENVCTLYLSSGKILIQQIEVVGTILVGKTDCDFVEDEACCDLNTYIISPNGDTKTIDCKYILSGTKSTGEELESTGIASNGYDYIISGVYEKIKDGKLDESKIMAIGVFDNGSTEEVKTIIKNQSMSNPPLRLANGNFIVQDIVGQYFLVNNGGKILRQINLTGTAPDDFNANFIKVVDKYYTLDGEEVTIPAGYTYYQMTSHLLILSKDGNLYTFDGSTTTLIGTDVKTELSYIFYTVANDAGTNFTYYNANGVKIGDINCQLTPTTYNEEGDVVIMQGVVGSETVYYRVS